MIRSYHREYTSSRPITEVKHGWAPPVPGTEMAQEAGVPNRFAVFNLIYPLFAFLSLVIKASTRKLSL